ncbi:MAG: hypothetical protein IT481_08300 [Gammaproteobacteria bacterium]|nr:hypothetical protein [Gammaproteobacteria bacterium]
MTRERGFVIRAKAAPRWAMGEISRHLRAGHGSQAAEMARRLMPFWHEIARRDDKSGMFDGALAVAAGIDDAHVASALLEPFTLLAVTPKSAPRLLELLERHGLEWCRALLRQWTTERPHHHETLTAQLKWLGAMLPAVCRRLCVADLPEGRELAAWLLEGRWAWMQTHLKQVRRLVDAGALGDRELVQESSQSAPALLALIDGSRIAGRHELHAQLIDCLTSAVDELPVQWPLGVLRAAQRTSRADTLGDLALQRPHERCRQILTARSRHDRFAAPARAPCDASQRASVRVGAAEDPRRVRARCGGAAILGRFTRMARGDRRRASPGVMIRTPPWVRPIAAQPGRPYRSIPMSADISSAATLAVTPAGRLVAAPGADGLAATEAFRRGVGPGLLYLGTTALRAPLEPPGRDELAAWLLVDERAVYEPLAWTPAEAHRLLRDVPVLERSGLVVRLPDWCSPARSRRRPGSSRLPRTSRNGAASRAATGCPRASPRCAIRTRCVPALLRTACA